MTDLTSVCFYCADQNTNRDRSRGITRYTQGLLSYVRPHIPRVTAVVSKSSFKVPAGIEQVRLPFATDNFAGRLISDQLHPLIVPPTNAQIWHYPKGFLPLGPQVKAKRVGTVMDVMLQFEADRHPESRSSLAFTYWIRMLKHSISKFDLILTISEFSRQAIFGFCERYKLRCPDVFVTYLGVKISLSSEQLQTVKDDYVLHLASHLPYKATTWLLQAWLELTRRGFNLPVLKLVGTVDRCGAELLTVLQNVTLAPPLPRDELERAIACARALILPSEIEGFGIPAVEAYLLRTPVAYASDTVLKETLGGDAPGGFERDADALYSALTNTLSLPAETIQNRAGSLKQKYNWADCAQRTIEAYRTVL